jgi:hypothetical protein
MAFQQFLEQQADTGRADWIDAAVLIASRVTYRQLTRDQRRAFDRLMLADIRRAPRRIHTESHEHNDLRTDDRAAA